MAPRRHQAGATAGLRLRPDPGLRTLDGGNRPARRGAVPDAAARPGRGPARRELVGRRAGARIAPGRRRWRGGCCGPAWPIPSRGRPGPGGRHGGHPGPRPRRRADPVPGGLGEYQVIVVDDGSRDPAAVAAVADCGRGALRAPRGERRARRRRGTPAWPWWSTPLVAFLDSDCVPAPGWLGPLLPHFGDPAVAAVAPRIVPYAAGRRSGRGGGLAGAVRGGQLDAGHGGGAEHRAAGCQGAVRAGRGARGPGGGGRGGGAGSPSTCRSGRTSTSSGGWAPSAGTSGTSRSPPCRTSTGSGWAAGSPAGWSTAPRPRRWNCGTRARCRRWPCPGGAPRRGPPPRSATRGRRRDHRRRDGAAGPAPGPGHRRPVAGGHPAGGGRDGGRGPAAGQHAVAGVVAGGAARRGRGPAAAAAAGRAGTRAARARLAGTPPADGSGPLRLAPGCSTTWRTASASGRAACGTAPPARCCPG